MKYHITLTSNTTWNLYNFRGNLIRRLLKDGHKVTTLSPADGHSKKLEALGCNVIDLPMDNKGTNPWRDLLLLMQFKQLYKNLHPDIALHYTIKPVIYGTLAAHKLNIPVINTITGLGTAFLQKGWLMFVVEQLYRLSLRCSARVIFQNGEDLDLFIIRKLVNQNKVESLPGSGVDLEHFHLTQLPGHTSTIFLLIARLLWDKGIGEFIGAARLVRDRYPVTRFRLLGPLGVANKSAISSNEVDAWIQEGLIEYLGKTDDVRPHITDADCVVLPSYREGSPRTLLEAAAMGRPVITTDVTGCRNVMETGVTGWLCKPRDAADLADKMIQFIALDQEQRKTMGMAGRSKMEQEFDESGVINRYVSLINEIINAYKPC